MTALATYDGSEASRAAVRWAGTHADTLIVASSVADAPALHLMPELDGCAWMDEVVTGDAPADAIVRCARRHRCATIVVARSDGVAGELLRIADVPVVLVPEPES